MRRVEQCPQRAGCGGAQAADHVRQANRVGTAPRHERELDEPLEFFLRLVQFVPVAVDRQHAAGNLVDADDVRQRAFALDVVDHVDFEHGAQTVLVVRALVAPLDLVVRLLGAAELRLSRGRDQIDIEVHASLDAVLVVKLRQVLDVRLALGAVEVGRGERQVHVVDCNEQELGAVARLVPRNLHVLATAQRHLRQQLLKLAPELGALGRELPVHEVGLALRLLDLLGGDVADEVVLHRTLRREQFLDGA